MRYTGVIEKHITVCSSTVDSGLPRWWNESISVRGTDGL
jgi:hypothetical protein